MPAVLTQPSVTIETLTEQEIAEGRCSHIVNAGTGGKGAAAVLEARIYGTPIEAMCGRTFVPERDPKRYPICPACKEIMDLYRQANDGLDQPTE